MKFIIVISFKNDYLPLKETLLSLGRQSFKNWELKVVDMGSIDGSRALVKSFGPERECKLLDCFTDNKFVAINSFLNKERLQGDFVQILEPGDRYTSPQSLELIVSKLTRTTDLMLCGYRFSNSREVVSSFSDKLKSDDQCFIHTEFPLCSLVWSIKLLSQGFSPKELLESHKQLVALVLRSSTKRVQYLNCGAVIRDAGNCYYIYHYAPVKIKESYKARYGPLSEFRRLFMVIFHGR